jgi:hypothetical protein
MQTAAVINQMEFTDSSRCNAIKENAKAPRSAIRNQITFVIMF